MGMRVKLFYRDWYGKDSLGLVYAKVFNGLLFVSKYQARRCSRVCANTPVFMISSSFGVYSCGASVFGDLVFVDGEQDAYRLEVA